MSGLHSLDKCHGGNTKQTCDISKMWNLKVQGFPKLEYSGIQNLQGSRIRKHECSRISKFAI